MSDHLIDTDKYSSLLRSRSIDRERQRILISNFHGTEQEEDFLEPANCSGFGRIRHFRRSAFTDWPTNPLPIDPAHKALGLGIEDIVRAQVFQNASCNWRCWYCFVPFELLTGSEDRGAWLTCGDLVDFYLHQQDPPPMIDLSGGQPDIVPEWVLWMMRELRNRNLHDSVYLWSDDNLSNDYFWKYLSDSDIETICAYKKYGRVCCLKGFDGDSFSFNTRAYPELFERQLELLQRFIGLGIDLYAYITLPCRSMDDASGKIARLLDRLQSMHVNLPLRVVPLKIQPFTPAETRMKPEHLEAMENQERIIGIWLNELERRFSYSDRSRNICDISINTNR